MTSEQWQQTKALFSGAVERPEQERRAYVRARAADEEVLLEVEAMLAAHRLDSTTDQPRPAESPKFIGRYRLLQPIGEGGMGVVYLAEQQHPVRRPHLAQRVRDWWAEAGANCREWSPIPRIKPEIQIRWTFLGAAPRRARRPECA
jgi:hypothetical protein